MHVIGKHMQVIGKHMHVIGKHMHVIGLTQFWDTRLKKCFTKTNNLQGGWEV